MASEALKVYQQVLLKADEDDGFRQRVLTDSRKAIEEELKIILPPHVQITVEEATRGSLKLVLPPKRRLRAGDTLSDADLANVVGGAKFCVCM